MGIVPASRHPAYLKIDRNPMHHIRRTYTIRNPLGLHARPASQLVKTAMKFECQITCEAEGQVGDAKSVMALMMLAVECGKHMTVEAKGVDAPDAIAALGQLIEDAFGEG